MSTSRPKLYRVVAAIYDEVLVNRYKDQHFWILGAFIPTFLAARLTVHYFPGLFLQAGGQHVHHFTYGFALLAISGYLAIVRRSKSPAWLAAMFGVGLALAVDETGMWLHLTNQYYNDTSLSVSVLALAFLINVVYFRHFWVRLLKEIFSWLKKT